MKRHAKKHQKHILRDIPKAGMKRVEAYDLRGKLYKKYITKDIAALLMSYDFDRECYRFFQLHKTKTDENVLVVIYKEVVEARNLSL